MKTTGLGVTGENVAKGYLRDKGYVIHKRNFISRFGEIDIVAEHDGFLCFVEVKTRGQNRIAEGREYITKSKQNKLIKTAEYFMVRNPRFTETKGLQPRFDCVEVYVGTDAKPIEINHLENIF